MPNLHLKVAPLQNPERYRSLARALTELCARVLLQPAERVVVLIDDLPAARWYVGGEATERPTAQLDLLLAPGVTTPAQRADFIEQAFQVLQRQLAQGGPLERMSHVLVHEQPVAHWEAADAPRAERSRATAASALT
ncbi:tautomerase family protein [Curvibacter sp. HBC61]|uniref:Tautomerase family protein n=1 Tax=Curvibacter cyanobacteriorum TaxID=3026422 RepID=A0ABT5N4X3_9BURK|nr:tautomerase family protein [Curvibacter sp. HBC61]MDD0840609.1 tautomerase family protein [Curvibacter sp. HBC61]